MRVEMLVVGFRLKDELSFADGVEERAIFGLAFEIRSLRFVVLFLSIGRDLRSSKGSFGESFVGL